jgi:hypothetical protein
VGEPTFTVDGVAVKDEIVGPPEDVVTIRVALFVAEWEAWSVTVTVTVKVPAEVARHASMAVSADAHPAGNPV